ncbi:TPA: ornithine cyclodeaminase family protein, partial [Legionella pneumophila]|nr:ornithine cyclodeaminase family protein [Legionella pneumophila]
FKSVGLAIQDLSVANAVYQNALKKNLGELFSIS